MTYLSADALAWLFPSWSGLASDYGITTTSDESARVHAITDALQWADIDVGDHGRDWTSAEDVAVLAGRMASALFWRQVGRLGWGACFPGPIPSVETLDRLTRGAA